MDVYGVRHEYRLLDGRSEWKLHRMASLLDAQMARAFGGHIMIESTWRSEQRRANPSSGTPCYRLEFSHAWWSDGSHGPAGEMYPSVVWKSYSMMPVIQISDAAKLGSTRDSWRYDYAKRLNRILGGDPDLAAQLAAEQERRRHDQRRVHPRVRELGAGDLIQYCGTRALVLSSEALNRNHRFGVAMIAPIFALPTVMDAVRRVLVPFDIGRVAYEYTQTIQPAPEDELVLLRKADKHGAMASRQAGTALRGILQRNHVRALIEYFEASREQRELQGLKSWLPPMQEPEGAEDITDIRTIERPEPEEGRSWTLGTADSAAAIEDDFLLESSHPDAASVWVSRRATNITFTVELTDGTEIEHAWLEDVDGNVLDAADQPATDDGPAYALVGTLDRSGRVFGRICVGSEQGLDEVIVDVRWNRSGRRD